ncbi:MAG: hypothetical protein C5S49_01550 [Candidatus Methanogaster sp.]|nr:MAG: hypothetical protein C5S49_01550 [ANME-2 cluster archaeon]
MKNCRIHSRYLKQTVIHVKRAITQPCSGGLTQFSKNFLDIRLHYGRKKLILVIISRFKVLQVNGCVLTGFCFIWKMLIDLVFWLRSTLKMQMLVWGVEGLNTANFSHFFVAPKFHSGYLLMVTSFVLYMPGWITIPGLNGTQHNGLKTTDRRLWKGSLNCWECMQPPPLKKKSIRFFRGWWRAERDRVSFLTFLENRSEKQWRCSYRI